MIRTVLMAAASAMVLGLAACDENGRARVDAPEPAPLAELTAEAADLPFAEPAPVEVYAPDQGYRWAERAYGLQRAVHDTPPDYGFAYGDAEPMVWETQDDWDLYAEPWDGGYRYYYYEPGAAYPYFVRDRDYGYAYDGAGVLIALFGADGRYLPRETVYRYAPTAGRYYVRGRDLRNAGLQARRTQVSEQTWRARAPRVQRGSDRWLQAAREEQSWRAWRERDHDRELARFEPETRRRAATQQAWREREGRLPSVERRDRADAREPREAAQAIRQQQAQDRREQQAAAERTRRVQQAEQQRRAQAEADRRSRSEQQRLAQTEQKRQQQAVEQRRQQQARAEQLRQAQAEQTRKKQDAAREQVRAKQQADAQQAQAEQRRQQQAAQQKQRQQAQAERQRQQQAAQQLQRQQAQAAERRQQQAAQREARQAERAQARAAEAQGQPAAARDRDGGKDRRGPDGKD